MHGQLPCPPRRAAAGYANPVAYFLQALAVNELESENWDTPALGDSGLTQGQLFLEQRGYFLGYHWVWLGLFAWGIGSTLLNTSLFMTASSFLNIVPRRKVTNIKADEGSVAAAAAWRLLHCLGSRCPLGSPALTLRLAPLPGLQIRAQAGSMRQALLTLPAMPRRAAWRPPVVAGSLRCPSPPCA